MGAFFSVQRTGSSCSHEVTLLCLLLLQVQFIHVQIIAKEYLVQLWNNESKSTSKWLKQSVMSQSSKLRRLKICSRVLRKS